MLWLHVEWLGLVVLLKPLFAIWLFHEETLSHGIVEGLVDAVGKWVCQQALEVFVFLVRHSDCLALHEEFHDVFIFILLWADIGDLLNLL